MATQIPLLRPTQKFQWLPSLLNLIIAGILTFFIYMAIFYHNPTFRAKFKWASLVVKCLLAMVILTVQIISLRSIRHLIEAVPDLVVQFRTYYETMFIFAFFAVNVVLESLT